MVKRSLDLAWPVALARLGFTAMSLVDVVVVGQFSPRELAWQALAWAPINVLSVSGIGLLVGVQILAARALGAGRPHEAGQAWRGGLVVAAVSGALAATTIWLLGARTFTGLGVAVDLATHAARVSRILALSLPFHLAFIASSFFLEATQMPLVVTWATLAANVLNLVLNLLLVPRFGAEGSAWCTLATRVLLAALLIGWIGAGPLSARFGTRRREEGGLNLANLLAVGTAALVSNAAEAGAFSTMTVLAGRAGPSSVSAYQILFQVLVTVFMVSLGISTSTSVLTAEAIGRNDRSEARRASWTGVALNCGFMLLIGLGLVAGASVIGRASTANLEIAVLVSGLMWLAALVVLPDGGQAVLSAALRASGDNWFPTVSHLFSYVLVMPALGFYLAEIRAGGVEGLMVAVLGASVVSFALLGARLLWLSSRASESA